MRGKRQAGSAPVSRSVGVRNPCFGTIGGLSRHLCTTSPSSRSTDPVPGDKHRPHRRHHVAAREAQGEERGAGPLLLAEDGGQLDRYDATRIVRRLTRAAGIGKANALPAMTGHA